MTLKNKHLLLLPLISLLLSACGGGGDGASNFKPAPENTANGTKYYRIQYYFDDKGDAFTASHFELQNRKIVTADSRQPLNQYIVTQQAVYEPSQRYQADIDVHSMSHWTLNLIADLKTDWKLEKVALSGKNIFDTVMPGYRDLRFDTQSPYANARIFLASHGAEKFPQGSTCYRLISTKNNQPYFSFQTNRAETQTFAQVQAQNQLTANLAQKQWPKLGIEHVKGQWATRLDWSVVISSVTGQEIAGLSKVQFNDQVYAANLNSASEWIAKNQIQFEQDSIAYGVYQDNPEQLRNSKLTIANLERGCFIYSQVAADKLATLSFIR